MVRHLFKELLDDGEEHSYKEISSYINDKTNRRSVDGGRLTDESIHSAIWYIFRHDNDFRYAQTRKGYYQKNNAQSLLSDGKAGLRQFSLRALGEAKEKIQLQADLQDMSEQEQAAVSRMLRNIAGAIDQAMERIDSNALDATQMTADTMEITDELCIEDDHINAYIAAWFDVDARFGTQTHNTDDYVNVYANYYPETEELEVGYTLIRADGSDSDFVAVELTDSERKAVLEKLKDAGLDECVAEMRCGQDEDAGMTFL
jgi:hypothetical protein